jgi:hypothetical protein
VGLDVPACRDHGVRKEHERIFVKRPTASITVTGDPKLQVRAATLAEATPEVYRPNRMRPNQ